ncbi:MAG TPA: hypothetical protein VLG47_07795 [Candidatus Saccharimonadales bacterium]|nr:hypothetical protein [Candidatus Saccharimonadales bacterium]
MPKLEDKYSIKILEEIRDRNKEILAIVGDMQKKVALLHDIRKDFDEIKQDVKVIKAAVTDQGKQVQDHERRIGNLEAAR